MLLEEQSESTTSNNVTATNIKSCDKINKEPKRQSQEGRLKVYKRRWFVLLIICAAISVRSFNQSCYGPINNILSDYFELHPWQIDWLNSSNALIFVLFSLPMILITTKLGFLFTVIAMLVLETISYMLITLGVAWRSTYSIAMVGQIFMATSTIIAASIPPLTAAIWFPNNEVATAVALHAVSRGIGEAVGCVVPSLILKNHSTPKAIMKLLVQMFSGLTVIAFGLTLAATFVVKDFPLLPPSEAQAKIRDARTTDESAKTTTEKFLLMLKKLFTNKAFIATWLVSGITNPIFRSNTVLFTSILRKNFLAYSHVINLESGLALLVGWAMFVTGGFITGPVITKTKAYKGIVILSLIALFISCILILIGLKIENLRLTFCSVIFQGFFMGMSNISLYEFLTEIIYPVNPMPAVMMVMGLAGLSMLTILIVCRFLLSIAGPLWSTLLPIIITGLAPIIIFFTKPTYLREQANNGENEETSLIISGGEKK